MHAGVRLWVNRAWWKRDFEMVCWCCNGGIQEMDNCGLDEIFAVAIDTLLVSWITD